jgi:short subunit dehydrogenase-like uncharacterized protein
VSSAWVTSARVSDERGLDIVVFGATGFVGRLVAGYLAEHAPDGVRIGLAGRSEERLAQTRLRLGPVASGWPLVVADSGDEESLASMVRGARVVATTVGPYRGSGLRLVDACIAAGTDYADLTGEVLFARESIERHAGAAEAGARIVHSCGFDSIPSDLGVLLLHEAAREHGDGELEDTTLVVTAFKGGLSGGTLASVRGQIDELRTNGDARRVIADPYALSPDRSSAADGGGERDVRGVGRDEELGGWVGPFVMAPYNTRVVRRSNALLDGAYGRRFRYREVSGFGTGPAAPVKAVAATAMLGALLGGLAFGPTRKVLDRVLPDPGEGPSETTRRRGCFRLEIHTRTSKGARYRATVAATGDPGYAATAMMMGESALCLALDRDRLPQRAGVLTPAVAMDGALADRLRAAGMTLAIERRS